MLLCVTVSTTSCPVVLRSSQAIHPRIIPSPSKNSMTGHWRGHLISRMKLARPFRRRGGRVRVNLWSYLSLGSFSPFYVTTVLWGVSQARDYYAKRLSLLVRSATRTSGGMQRSRRFKKQQKQHFSVMHKFLLSSRLTQGKLCWCWAKWTWPWNMANILSKILQTANGSVCHQTSYQNQIRTTWSKRNTQESYVLWLGYVRRGQKGWKISHLWQL